MNERVIIVRPVPLLLRVKVILAWTVEKHVNAHRVQGDILLLKDSIPTT